MGWRRRSAATAHDDWTSEVSSGLALAGFLFLVFIGFTLLAMGPLISLDAYFNLAGEASESLKAQKAYPPRR